MLRKPACLGAVLVGVVCLMGTFSRRADAQQITVHVVQVLASNEGEEYVDPALGALGRRLKRTYPYRSYRQVGSSSQSGGVGSTLRFPLQGGMLLAVALAAYDDPVVSMQAVVTQGRQPITSTNLRVKTNGTMIIAVPIGDNRLILAITPQVR